ncbi:hypothetical protein FACS189459_0760 [Bacilli bacterium]|nr:hypothetical protein FACS189459_0760 [Bacilli bacterium]
MNKFRILIPLLVTPAIVAPICLSTTSCLAGSTITPKTIDFDNFSKETKYSDLKSCGKNFWNLMYGKTNNYNHGDYVIFMGLSTDASLSNVLFSDKDSEQYDSKSLKSYDLLNALPSINTIISQDKDNPVQSLKILSYVGRVIYNMPETNYDVNSKKFVPTYEATPFSK